MRVETDDQITPYVEDVVDALERSEPVLRKAAKVLRDPQARTRPDRFLGRAGRGDEISTWAPGYERHLEVQVTNGAINETTTRPYAPILSEDGEQRIEDIVVAEAFDLD